MEEIKKRYFDEFVNRKIPFDLANPSEAFALWLFIESEIKAIQGQAKVIVNFADIENKLKAVTQIVDIGIFAENAMIEGLIADQRVIAYKDALRICKELVSKISK